MLEVYLIGLATHLFLVGIHLARLPFVLGSAYARNLKRIGRQMNWITLSSARIAVDDVYDDSGLLRRFLSTAVFLSLLGMFSWLSVAVQTFFLVGKLVKWIATPPEVRLGMWRVHHLDLDAREIYVQFAMIRGVPEDDRDAWADAELRELEEHLKTLEVHRRYAQLEDYQIEIKEKGLNEEQLALFQRLHDECWNGKITLEELKQHVALL